MPLNPKETEANASGGVFKRNMDFKKINLVNKNKVLNQRIIKIKKLKK